MVGRGSPRRMTLAHYYFADPRLVLVPIEHLTPAGMSAEFARLLADRRGWLPAQVALFDAAFALYWSRSDALARCTVTWPAPRLRHVGLVTDPLAVRPYVQLLNTSAWTLYESDCDPTLSHPEFVAYLLVHGDRMAVSGEVGTAAVHSAAYWFERSDEECAAFAAAAWRVSRPDAATFQAVAAAFPWLRALRHETLRPLVVPSPHRPIPGTGLLVPRALEAEPPALAARERAAAEQALQAYRRRWRSRDAAAGAVLCDWLVATSPPLLVTAQGNRIVWDADAPSRVGALRAALREADAIAVQAISTDLQVIERHTRAFFAAVVDAGALPVPPANTDQSGYSYLHCERRLIAYNLDEPGMERLRGAPLPYAGAMLGARTAHEWAHLADAAGWVPRTAPPACWAERKALLAAQLDAVVGAAPAAVRMRTGADLAELSAAGPAGAALTRILLTRMPDYRANLVARGFMSEVEKETYVRHNIRTLRPHYLPAHLWRMLIRYLYEYQYLGPDLGLSTVPDRRVFFLRSTWFDEDFLVPGVLDVERFDALAEAVARLCACYAVDERRFNAHRVNPLSTRG